MNEFIRTTLATIVVTTTLSFVMPLVTASADTPEPTPAVQDIPDDFEGPLPQVIFTTTTTTVAPVVPPTEPTPQPQSCAGDTL